MNKKASRPSLDDDDDALAQRITETAKQQGIPSLVPITSNLPTGSRRPIKVEVSDTLFDALTVAAAQQHVTKRFLILLALRNAGYPVEEADFREDGRRLRGSRKA